MDGNVEDLKVQQGLAPTDPIQPHSRRLQSISTGTRRCWYPPVPTPQGWGASVSKGSVQIPFVTARVGTFGVPLMQLNK